MLPSKRLLGLIGLIACACLLIGYSVSAQRAAAGIKTTAGKSKTAPKGRAQEEKQQEGRDRVVQLDRNADPTPRGPISMTAEAFGVTPPIRDTEEFRHGPKPPGDGITIEDNENNEVEVDRTVPEAWADSWKSPDALAEKSRIFARDAPQVMPGPSLTFTGILSNNLLTTFGTTSMPPDTAGDVGPSHYVQATNFGVFQVFDKTGVALGSTLRISSLFAGLPANNKCRLRDNGDIIVNYDPMADRWLISQFALTDDGGDVGTPFYQCMAVSQTGDPTGAYFAYAFKGPNNNFPDYPHWGVWTDGYYLATHEFNDAGTAYVQGGFFAFNRNKMLVGDPTANFIYFSVAASFGHLPADIDGYMPPAAGTPEMFFRYDADEFGGTDSLIPYEFVPNYTTPASSTFTTLAALPVAAFDPRNPSGRLDIEQPAPATASHNLDALGSNMMFRVGYRNLGTIASPTNSYVMNYTVNVSGVAPSTAGTYQAAIRWEELRRSGAGAMSVFDQGTHAPDAVSGTGRNRWMGSIAQDNNGNLALGFSRSGPGATEFPDIVWAGRSGGMVAAGTMNEGEATMFASTGSQSATNSRWGDYSNMTVDPVDDCSFWYTQEWRDSANNGTATNNPFKWSTRIGTFKFPGCTNALKGTISVNVTSCSSGAPISGATVGTNPGGFFRLTNGAGNLVSSISAAPGSYTVTATKNGVSATPQVIAVSNAMNTPVSMCIAGPVLASGAASIVSESCSPADSAVNPGETVTVNLPVSNIVAPNTSNLVGTLQRTGGVIGVSAPQNYGVVTAGGAAVSRPFTFVTDADLTCGSTITLSLVLTDGASNFGTVTYTMPVSSTAGSPTTVTYSGAPVAIPDGSATGANATVVVSGFTGNIADLDFRLNGTSAVTGSSGLDHTWVGDVVLKLTSPQGSTATLINRIDSGGGNGNCSNDNFFNTVLDDEAAGGVVIDNNCTAGMTGSFKPAIPLSLFDGENPNGTWTVNVADLVTVDTGTLRAFGLVITPVTCCTSQKRWTGATSADWDTAGNWNPSGAPGAADTAIIPSTGVTNEPNISASNVTISGLIVASNRTLTVTSPRTLTVTNSSVVNGIVNVTGAVALNTFADLNNSTFNYNGSGAQTAGALTYNNLTVNNAAGVALGGDTTVNGSLALTLGDLNTGAFTLTMPNTATSSGTTDVVGNVKRTGFVSGGSALSFGNPFNTISIDSGTAPTDINVNLVKAEPSGSMGFPNAVKRTYTITPNGGSGISATLKLHYLAGELNGNTEGSLQLWRFNSGSSTWNLQGRTGAVDTVNKAVTRAGITQFSAWTLNSNAPTAANGAISGRITGSNGLPLGGVIMSLSGQSFGTTITDANGNYRFDSLETSGFYTVTPAFVNYHFSPANRSFSLVGSRTDATFTAAPDAAIVANAIDTSEYFVRQQYLDFLGREPDAPGFNYWSDQINSCNGDADCVRAKRIDVSAAFFLSQEFADTGSFVFRLYKGALGRQLRYSEFAADRTQVVGGPNLEASKTAFADAFVQRAEFTDKYQGKTSAEAFVDALLQTMNDSAGVNLGSERAALINRYNEGASLNASRALVVRQLVDNDTFAHAVSNQAFVAMQYFAYLRRSPDAEGNTFWLNVLNNNPQNYRGMVCSFITSTEYQRRFSTVVSHSNAECGR